MDEKKVVATLTKLDELGEKLGMLPNEIELQRVVNFAIMSFTDLQSVVVGQAVSVGMDLYEKYAVEAGILEESQIPLVRSFIKQRSQEISDERAKNTPKEFRSDEIGIPEDPSTPTNGGGTVH